MGQKVNPHGLRVGIIKDWDSKWYAEKDYEKFLLEDIKIREFIKEKLFLSGISKVEIERASNRARISINTAKPRMLIGRQPSNIELLKNDMKKMLFTALVAACAMTACGTKTTETATAEEVAREVGSSDIAYVQVEAVLAQCDLFLNEGAALQEKTQKAQKSWAQKEQNLQAEAAQLQEKYQKGLITTNDAQAQQQSIEKRVASYQSSAQKEAQALDEENYVFTNRAQDLLHRAVQEINGDKKYKLIINATALIDADSTLNITPAVLAKVNELYAADKKAAKK